MMPNNDKEFENEVKGQLNQKNEIGGYGNCTMCHKLLNQNELFKCRKCEQKPATEAGGDA